MQAQAERERQARVILGDSERQVAEKFGEAAKTYADNPTAFHLRAMNMLYEGLKRDNATIVIVPSTAVETMQLGATIASLSTMAAANGQSRRAAAPAGERFKRLELDARRPGAERDRAFDLSACAASQSDRRRNQPLTISSTHAGTVSLAGP